MDGATLWFKRKQTTQLDSKGAQTPSYSDLPSVQLSQRLEEKTQEGVCTEAHSGSMLAGLPFVCSDPASMC